MENFNRIIESLSVRYIKARNLVLLKPLEIENYFDVENTIIYLNKGDVVFNDIIAKEGSILFIPAGRTANLAYVTGSKEQLSYQKFIGMAENYFDLNKNPDVKSVERSNYILFNFEAKIFDSVNFFSSLDIPPFIIKNAPKIEDFEGANSGQYLGSLDVPAQAQTDLANAAMALSQLDQQIQKSEGEM